MNKTLYTIIFTLLIGIVLVTETNRQQNKQIRAITQIQSWMILVDSSLIETIERKQDKLDYEMNPDRTQLRMIEFQWHENIRKFWKIIEDVRKIQWMYLFAWKWWIYSRDRKEGIHEGQIPSDLKN